jgi:hypothetical protein
MKGAIGEALKEAASRASRSLDDAGGSLSRMYEETAARTRGVVDRTQQADDELRQNFEGITDHDAPHRQSPEPESRGEGESDSDIGSILDPEGEPHQAPEVGGHRGGDELEDDGEEMEQDGPEQPGEGSSRPRSALVQRRRSLRTRNSASPYATKETPFRSKRLQQMHEGLSDGGGAGPSRPNSRPLPTKTPEGDELWNGTRSRLGFTEETKNTVFDSAEKREAADGSTEYRCTGSCGGFYPRSDLQIDHKKPILDHVNLETSMRTFHPPEGSFEGMTLNEAREAANDLSNLRVMCGPCNSGRNRRISSKGIDTSNPTKWLD